jgi:hypothetical protein
MILMSPFAEEDPVNLQLHFARPAGKMREAAQLMAIISS